MSLNLDRSTWRRVKFGDVVRQCKESTDPEADGVERYVAGEHMDTDNLKISRWGEVGDGYLGPAFHRRFKSGQILYGSRRTYLRKVALADFDGVCANTTFVMESADPAVLLPELLPFIMSTETFHAHSIAESKGSVNPYVNWPDIAKYEFDLPPLADQRRIADLLWAIEQHSRQLACELESAHTAHLTFIDRNFGVSSAAVPLAELTAPGGIRIGPFGAQLHASDYQEDGVPVVMPQDMTGNRINSESIQRVSVAKAEELSAHAVKDGDVLLPRRGELDRRALVTDQEEGWLCGTGSVRVRLNAGANPTAVLLALSATSTVEWIRRNASGTTMPNLNAGIVARIPVTMPPESLLESVLEGNCGIEASVGTLKEEVERLKSMRQALLRGVFGGGS